MRQLSLLLSLLLLFQPAVHCPLGASATAAPDGHLLPTFEVNIRGISYDTLQKTAAAFCKPLRGQQARLTGMGRWQPADPWVQACAAKTGLVEGQSCSFQLAGQRLMGACTQKFFPPAAAAPMLCIPAEVLVAGQHCQQSSQRAGDECGYQLGDHMVHGVCGWDEVATRRGCFSATASKFLRLMEDVVARDTASHQVTALIQQLISSSPASASSSASSSSASSSSASSSASPPFASDSMVAVERQAELQFLPLATTCAEAETSGKLPMMLTLASKASLSHQWPPARSFQISSTAAGDKSLLRQAVGSYIAAQLNVTNAFTPAFARVTLEGQYIGVFDFHPSVLSQALPYSPESANSSADQATSAAEQSEAAINSSASEEQLHAVTAADSDTAASAAKSDSSNEGDDADADDDDDDDHGSSDDEEEEEEEDGETLRRKDWQRRAAEAVASLPEPPGSDPRHPRNRVGVAQVLLDYVARSEKEISVSRGQLIGELDHVNGWTRVSNANGSQGWMPSSLLRNVSCKALPSTLYRPLDALNSFKPNSFYPWIGMLPSPWWAPGLRLFRALSSDDRLNDADTTEHQPLVGTKPARLAESVNITSLLAYLAVAAGAKIAHPFGQSELNYALLLDPCTGQLHVVGHDFQAFGATSFTLGDFDQHATSAAYRLVHAALGVSSWRRQYLKFGQQVLQIMASMKEQGILQRWREQLSPYVLPSSAQGEKETLTGFDYDAWEEEVDELQKRLQKRVEELATELQNFERNHVEKKAKKKKKTKKSSRKTEAPAQPAAGAGRGREEL